MTLRSAQQLIELFNAKPVIVFDEMKKILDTASRATVFRYLAKVSYRRSYNFNGRYYTKHDITRYDSHGIYSYKGIHFSIDGNLAETILKLVYESSSGYTQRELQDLLQVRVQTSLANMVYDKKLSRTKVIGLFVYFHPDSKFSTVQLTNRHKIIEDCKFNAEAVTDAVVIQVLLILIWHPESRAGDVAHRLKGYSPPITMKHVRVVFDRYNLDDVGKKRVFQVLNHLWSVVDHGDWPSMEIARAIGSNESHIPRVDFIAETDSCPVCGVPAVIARSKKRTVVTYAAGMFEAVDVQKQCSVVPSHPLIKSEVLTRIVRPHQRFSYDLIVQVGLLRYLKKKQREEICDELFRKRSIKLSTGSVSNLCNRFLIYLEALHFVRSPHLKAAIQEYGYPLHIDATSDHGKGGLFVCMDGFRNWVLWAGKIESESEEHLKPFIEKTIDLFGYPIGVVRDLGTPGKNAAAFLVKKGILDFVCHYHFLGAIGKKLFDSPYAFLRNFLRQSQIRTDLRQLLKEKKQQRGKGPDCIRENLLALLHWIIAGDGKKDVTYPFSLPHLEFFQRCRIAMKRADIWVPMPRNHAERRTLSLLEGLIQQLVKKEDVQEVVGSLEIGWQAFTSARNSLRLTDAELPRGDKRYQQTDLPMIEAKRLKEIEKQVELYLSELRKIVGDESLKKPVSPHGIILKYFNKYRNQLFGHPVILDNNGTVIAVVQRTNNVNEHFFGKEKQRLRRRVGRAHLGRDLEDQPAQVALAANLHHPDYVRILCGSLEHLHISFANLDEYALNDTTPLVRSNRDTVLQEHVRMLLKNLCESDALNEESPE